MRISDWSSDVCSSDLQRRRRCDRTVVIGVAQARAAGTVVEELALLALVDLHRALRAVAGGQAPDVLAVPLPVHRVLDRLGALCQRGAAAVLEVVDAARKIGRASCRARVFQYVYLSGVAVAFKNKKKQ